MKLSYAELAVMVSFVQSEAVEKNYLANSVDELIEYLDENTDGFINVIEKSE